MKVRFLDPAQQELNETISYYNAELVGLGEAFLLEVLSAIERIRQYPRAWHPLSENTRRCQLKRFPYGLIYEADEAEALIIAVANLHRRPRLLAQPPCVVARPGSHTFSPTRKE